MVKTNLETLAIAKIREHRLQMEADQEVYEEWSRACDDPSTSTAVLRTLQDEYLKRQRHAEQKQDELADILDELGYVPTVPENDNGARLD
jgi:TraR antiactivator